MTHKQLIEKIAREEWDIYAVNNSPYTFAGLKENAPALYDTYIALATRIVERMAEAYINAWIQSRNCQGDMSCKDYLISNGLKPQEGATTMRLHELKAAVLVETPNGAKGINLDLNVLHFIANKGFEFIKLPPGTYCAPIPLLNVSEEQAKQIVSSIKGGWYRDYEVEGIYHSYKNATASLHSLVKSLGWDIENTYCLIKK